MAGPRTTFLLACSVVLATTWLGFFEIHALRSQEIATDDGSLLALSPPQIERIRIKRDAWTELSLARIDEASFRVTEPREQAIDAETMNRLLSLIEFLEVGTELRGEAEDASRTHTYGLSPAALELEIGLSDGREVKIAFGMDLPVGETVYLMVQGRSSVHIVDRELRQLCSELLEKYTEAPTGLESP